MIGPDYSPEKVQKILMSGLTTKEAIELRTKGLDKFNEGSADDGLAMWLATASNQEEWTKFLDNAPEFGVDPAIINSFPKEWSPEAVAAARVRAMTTKEAQELEIRRKTEERQAAAEARLQAQAAATAARDQARLELEQRRVKILEDAERRRAAGGTTRDLTPAEKNRALEWRMDSRADLKKRKSDPMAPLSESEFQAEMREIEDVYRQMIGQPPAPPSPPPPTPPTVLNPGAPAGAPIRTRGTGEFAPVRTARSPEVRAQVREILRNSTGPTGKPLDSSDAAIDRFLKSEANRKALGIR
jgi:hypothetical protein